MSNKMHEKIVSPSCVVNISLSILKAAGLEIEISNDHLHIYLNPEDDEQFDRLMNAVPTTMPEEDQDELMTAISKAYNHIIIKRLFTGASKMKVRNHELLLR